MFSLLLNCTRWSVRRGYVVCAPGPPGRPVRVWVLLLLLAADEGSGVRAERARVSSASVWILVLARTEWVRPPDRHTARLSPLRAAAGFSRPMDAARMWGPFCFRQDDKKKTHSAFLCREELYRVDRIACVLIRTAICWTALWVQNASCTSTTTRTTTTRHTPCTRVPSSWARRPLVSVGFAFRFLLSL